MSVGIVTRRNVKMVSNSAANCYSSVTDLSRSPLFYEIMSSECHLRFTAARCCLLRLQQSLRYYHYCYNHHFHFFQFLFHYFPRVTAGQTVSCTRWSLCSDSWVDTGRPAVGHTVGWTCAHWPWFCIYLLMCNVNRHLQY